MCQAKATVKPNLLVTPNGNRNVKTLLFLVVLLFTLTNPAYAVYTIFDGKSVDEIKDIATLWVKAQRLVGEALYRSREAMDDSCEKQWQIPITTGISHKLYPQEVFDFMKSEFNFDSQKATVIYADKSTGLFPRDILLPIEGDDFSVKNIKEMVRYENRLIGWNHGDDTERSPFKVKVEGKDGELTITPYQTCKGRVNVWIVPIPGKHDFFYRSFAIIPPENFKPDVSPDEVLWMTLWVQGFEVEGQGSMSMLTLSRAILGTVQGYMAGSATNSVIQAGTKSVQNLARETASQVAQSAASRAGKQAIVEAAKSQAEDMLKETMVKAVATNAAARFGSGAITNGPISMENFFVESAFAKADVWAFSKLLKLGVKPDVVVSLHKKLVDANVVGSPFILTPDRQQQFDAMMDAIEMEKAARNAVPPTSVSEVSVAQEK